MFPFFRCDVVTFKKPWDPESLSNFVKIIAELRLLLKDKVSVIAESIMIFRAGELFFFIFRCDVLMFKSLGTPGLFRTF
jgi:hypothetical protein